MSVYKVKEMYDYIKMVNGGEITSNKPINIFGFCAQISLETGYLEKYNHFNLAGIKCTKSWVDNGGECFKSKTPEDFGKGFVDTVGSFRKYNDTDHFIKDYSRLIHNYYTKCSNNYDNVFGYFAGLHGIWATDRSYFSKLCKVSKILAPHLLGIGWLQSLRESFNIALERKTLEDWMIKEIKNLFEF